MSDSLLVQLQQGVDSMELAANVLPLQSYLSYIELLAQWNQAYNLTAIHEPEKMLAYHILDSLSILPFIYGDECLDIGTGAGLPGIILALARPDTHWVLLDGNSKKTRFVQQAVLALNLENVDVVYSRIEHYEPKKRFSTIVSRAFTSLNAFIDCSCAMLSSEGRLLAMKGPEPAEEISNVTIENVSIKVMPLVVPGVTGDRNLVEITPKSLE